MYGWTGNVLRIDLTRKEVWRETLPEKAALAFVGGRGLNASYLYRELQPRTDPLGPDSKIMISGGPCNGTLVPGSTRFTISFKSPLTGLLGDSNSGSTFGVSLKYAGYDLLIIQGKAEAPTYVWIDGEAVQFRPAAHLMGKTTGETRRAIESEIGNPAVSVISIGPAGERLVKIACVIGDLGRAAGRSGAGAVFGSKNLKAIAVRGQRGVRVADRRLLEEAWRELVQAWQAHEALYETRTKLGTAGGMVYFQQSGILPTKNYQRGSYECFSDVHPRLLAERYFLKPKACFSCPVPCQHLHIIDRGPYAGESGEGLELGQLEHFSSRIMVNDLDVIVKAAILCNEYGVDIFEAGQIIGFAMECYDRRILTAADLDGIELEWGNGQGALELIKKVGLRQGAGRLFADGVSAASIAVGEGSDLTAILFKTGAAPLYGTDQYFKHYLEIHHETVRWMAQHGIILWGVDASTIDHAHNRATHMLLRELEFYHMENLANLDALPLNSMFTLACIPLPFTGATASPLRPIAILK